MEQKEGLSHFQLDYCNVLYMRLYLKSIWKLHLVHNASSFIQEIQLLDKLPKLIVSSGVQFKVLAIIFKAWQAWQGMADYLSHWFQPILSEWHAPDPLSEAMPPSESQQMYNFCHSSCPFEPTFPLRSGRLQL